ncbi:MAG: hypothetical protein WCJ61_04790 [Paludibacter sp.]
MTRQEFENEYLVEPLINDTEVTFNVYRKKVLDFSTPKIQLQNTNKMLESLSGEVIGGEIKKYAFTFIEAKYNIID